jgi:hypothetical protein
MIDFLGIISQIFIIPPLNLINYGTSSAAAFQSKGGDLNGHLFPTHMEDLKAFGSGSISIPPR